MSATVGRPYMFTSVGKKMLMGVTGLIWALFVLVHMIGNLLILVSPDAYNLYGHAITSGPILYPTEAILVLALVIHTLCALSLVKDNLASRGHQGYAVAPQGKKAPSLASRTMIAHGTIILFFAISHLATFKYGAFYETTVHGVVMRDLHRLVVEVFQQPVFLVWYIVALVVLGVHLSHGIGSLFQSLGLQNDRFAPIIKKISLCYSVVVTLGFVVQPLYVFFLLVKN